MHTFSTFTTVTYSPEAGFASSPAHQWIHSPSIPKMQKLKHLAPLWQRPACFIKILAQAHLSNPPNHWAEICRLPSSPRKNVYWMPRCWEAYENPHIYICFIMHPFVPLSFKYPTHLWYLFWKHFESIRKQPVNWPMAIRPPRKRKHPPDGNPMTSVVLFDISRRSDLDSSKWSRAWGSLWTHQA